MWKLQLWIILNFLLIWMHKCSRRLLKFREHSVCITRMIKHLRNINQFHNFLLCAYTGLFRHGCSKYEKRRQWPDEDYSARYPTTTLREKSQICISRNLVFQLISSVHLIFDSNILGSKNITKQGHPPPEKNLDSNFWVLVKTLHNVLSVTLRVNFSKFVE